MSQTRTRTQVRHQANISIVEMLEEELLQCESTNYKFTLRKALRAIRAYGEPIDSKEKALKVPYVGNHIATQIHIHLLEQPSMPAPSSDGGPRVPEGGAMLLPEESEPAPVTAPASSTRRRPRGAKGPRRKEYVPQYRSTPYAILIALYHAESSGITSMRKDDLARSAQQYTDRPVLTQGSDDPSSWYDGWSSVNRTLVSKGLVARGGNPIKFSLSATGRELAERLVEMNNEVLTMGAREYRTDRSIPVGVGNLPQRSTTARSRSAAANPASRNVTGPSNAAGDILQHPSEEPSQEELDLQVARTLASRFQEEDAADVGIEPRQTPQQSQSTIRATSQPRANPETTAALNRKYSAGQEYGTVNPDNSQPTDQSRPTSQPKRKKLTQAQCDRATKAIHRLEAGGYSRADCIKIVDILHAENAFPRSVDGVHQAVVNALWDIEKEERGLRRSSEPIGLTISALDSFDGDDDDAAFRHDKGKRVLSSGEESTGAKRMNGIVYIPRDSALRPSSSKSLARTPELTLRTDSASRDCPSSSNAVQQIPDSNPNIASNPRDSLFRPSSSSTFERTPDRNSQSRDTALGYALCHSNADAVPLSLARKPKRENVPSNAANDAVVVIDLDNDNPQVAPSHSQKRPRVADVIAIDSDDESDIPELTGSETPTKPSLEVRRTSQSLSRANDIAHNDTSNSSVMRSNTYQNSSIQLQERTYNVTGAEDRGVDIRDSRSIRDLSRSQGAKCEVVLLLDSMERFRNSNTMARHVKSPGDLLLEEGVDCEVRPLPTGDALFIARFPDNTEVVLDYIIERKSIDDYGSSMKDGRVARQSYMMRHAKIKRRVFLLEGDLKENEDLYNKTELHKKLAEMTMCSGLYVRHTRDIQDTIHFYASLFRRLQKKFVNQTKAMTLRERSLFPDWNERMSVMKKTISMEQLFMIQLCQIPGLGTTKAQAIVDMGYKTPFLLYKAYKELNSEEEQDVMLNKGEYAIGSGASKAVSSLFNHRQYTTIVKPSPHK